MLRRSPSCPRLTRSTWVLGVLMLAAVLSTRWVRLNISSSVPLGFYRLTALEAAPRPGTLVLLSVPAVMRPWWSSWALLLKPIAAVAGEEVCVEQGWLRIGTNWVGPVLTEAHGKPLPHLVGCQRVGEGEVFLASEALNSLDSRYFGAVAIQTLRAEAVPLWTW
jgi:type IV secretory pathway protease TraF